MAGPIAVDTPDYQRGVVSAQVEVCTARLSGGSVTFGVPPNAESLIAFFSAATLLEPPQLSGVSTGLTYTGTKIADGANNLSGVWVYDAAPALDATMRVGGGSPIDPLTVTIYADAGVHVTADSSKLTNFLGQQYVIPSAPSTLAGDHPPVELQSKTVAFAGAGALLPAAGAGKRYRMFAAQITLQSGTLYGYLEESSAGGIFLTGGAGGPGQLSFPLSGLPMPTNAGVNFTVGNGAGIVVATVIYTLETV